MKLRYDFEIKGSTCIGCPLLHYLFTWDEHVCGGLNNKSIEKLVEHPSELRDRPDWCPCKEVEDEE